MTTMIANSSIVNAVASHATLANTIKHTKLLFTAIACGILCFSHMALAANKSPVTESTGAESSSQLVNIDKRTGFDHVKILGGIDFSQYTHVIIHTPNVSFQKSWERDHRTDVSSRYKKMIKEDYAKLLINELIKALTKEEKIIVVEANTTHDGASIQNPHTLTIIPNITSLFINGPETITTSTSYVFEAGRATLQLQLMDANQQTLAIIEDRDDTKERSFLNRPERASRIRNYHDFRLLMRGWSNDFAKLLRHSTPQSSYNVSNN